MPYPCPVCGVPLTPCAGRYFCQAEAEERISSADAIHYRRKPEAKHATPLDLNESTALFLSRVLVQRPRAKKADSRGYWPTWSVAGNVDAVVWTCTLYAKGKPVVCAKAPSWKKAEALAWKCLNRIQNGSDTVTDADTQEGVWLVATQIEAEDSKETLEEELPRLEVTAGPYRIVLDGDGVMDAYRGAKRWRHCTGDDLIEALVRRVSELEQRERESA